MGTLTKHSKVNLIIGVITKNEKLLQDATKHLRRKFGAIDYQSPIIDFNFTDYYEKEMGLNLKRCFFSFKKLIAPETLCDIKLYTNGLEKKFSRSKNKPSRTINLDPGYITAAKLVLATTKDYAHRVYLAKGIFAEITMHFKNGGFQHFNWTYPDYRTQEYKDVFNRIRALYLRKKHG
ncbi:MAG: DUF4416 family protein [Candidatus Omnitrophota bacterium]